MGAARDFLATALATCVAAAGTAAMQAEDAEAWTRFRGPNGSGVAESEGLPAQLDPEDGVRWRTPLPPGRSSPVLSDELVLLTGYEDEALLVLALERTTGEVRWRREAPRDRVSKVDARNDAASPSPVVAGDRVVAFFPDYGLVAYGLDGEPAWRVPLGPFDNMYGMGASPVVEGERVLLACDQSTGSYLLAVSLADGEELWRTPRPEARSGHCTPIVYRPENAGPQLLLPGSFLLDAYDLASGKKVWWASGLSFEMKSVPVLHKGLVFVNGYGSPMNQPGNQVEVPTFAEALAAGDADGDGRIAPAEMPESRAKAWFAFVDLDGDGHLTDGEWAYLEAALGSLNGMLAIRAGGTGNRTDEATVWSYRRSVPQLPSPLVYRDVLYMLNDSGGLLVAFRPEDGEVLTKGRLEAAQDNYYASPVAGGGRVYFVSESGIVTVLPAGGSFEPTSTTELDERCYTTPALSRGRVFLRTEQALYCFGDG